jgi:hypothetical protein
VTSYQQPARCLQMSMGCLRKLATLAGIEQPRSRNNDGCNFTELNRETSRSKLASCFDKEIR